MNTIIKRLSRFPIIRHVRAVVAVYCVERHYQRWASAGMLPVHKDRDYAVIRKIWRGEA